MMIRSLWRLAVGSSLSKALRQRSRAWWAVVGGLVAVRLLERLTRRRPRPAK